MEQRCLINSDSLLSVARITKSYHTEGEVVIKITSPFFVDYKQKDPVFIFFNSLPVPFFITECNKRGNNGAILKFSTVRDFFHSEELLNKEIYIDTLKLPKKVQKEIAADGMQDNIIGYALLNQDNVQVGTITNFIEYPNNACIEVNGQLLPIHPDLILDINLKKHTIKMQIPEGLL